MRYLVILTIVFTFSLVGCSGDSESNQESENSNIDNSLVENSNYSGSFSGSIFLRYENFDEMLKCEYCNFVEGKVISISSFNNYVDKVFIEIINSGFADKSEIINISVGKGDTGMIRGGTYVLNLFYEPTNDYYSLSQGQDSIFRIVDGFVTLPERFINEDLPLEVEEFLSIISINN